MFLLKFTSPYRETFYFLRLGEQWPHEPRFRLIDATVRDREQARQFATEEDARAVWSRAGSPACWDVVSQ